MTYIMPCPDCSHETKIDLTDTQYEMIEDSGFVHCPICGNESPGDILEEDE